MQCQIGDASTDLGRFLWGTLVLLRMQLRFSMGLISAKVVFEWYSYELKKL
jgi:hypothetical protein